MCGDIKPSKTFELSIVRSYGLTRKTTSDFAVVNDIDYDYIPDVSERSEYADEILALYRAGILTGDERTRAFRPSDTITRAEAAAIISRVALPTTRIKIV